MNVSAVIKTLLISLLLMPSTGHSESSLAQNNVRYSSHQADLTISDFSVRNQSGTAYYSVTFKNIGQGPAGCFDYKIGDSVKRIRIEQVCPARDWLLRPGEEITQEGRVQEKDMWQWPDEYGYNSKLHIFVNHGGKVTENVISNNRSGRRMIRWGL